MILVTFIMLCMLRVEEGQGEMDIPRQGLDCTLYEYANDGKYERTETCDLDLPMEYMLFRSEMLDRYKSMLRYSRYFMILVADAEVIRNEP